MRATIKCTCLNRWVGSLNLFEHVNSWELFYIYCPNCNSSNPNNKIVTKIIYLNLSISSPPLDQNHSKRKCFYLPSLDSDTSQSIGHCDVSDGDIWNASFSVSLPKPSDADSVSRSTIDIVYVYIWASSLYGHAVVSCIME